MVETLLSAILGWQVSFEATEMSELGRFFQNASADEVRITCPQLS